MLEVLSAVVGYALTHLAEPVGLVVATTLVTRKVVRSRDAAGEVAQHDRRVVEINEDLPRWIRDRDRVARLRVRELLQQARAKGVERGGAMQQATGKVYAIVLHEYRDEAIAMQRECDSLVAGEGRTHVRYRRRHGRARGVLTLSGDGLEILERWRALAQEDVSRAELEPYLVGLERPALAA